MLLTKEVSLTINNRCVKYYKEKGYNVKGGQTIIVKVEDLTSCSNVLVDIKCDKCGVDKKIKYNLYNDCTKNQSENYYCQKCNDIKRKIKRFCLKIGTAQIITITNI